MRKIAKRLIFILGIIMVYTVHAFGKGYYNISFNGIKYSKGYLRVGVLNNSNNAVKFSFKSISEEKGREVVKYYDTSKDTLILELLPELFVDARTGSHVEESTHCPREIKSKETLRLFVRIKKEYIGAFKYLKIVLPNGQTLVEEIRL